MLISIVLALISETAVTLPSFVGRANYAATLAMINRVDAELAAQIHAGEGPKPLTCSSLLNVRPTREGLAIHAGQLCHVRITGLAPAVSAVLATSLLEQPPAQWELHNHLFGVSEVICDPARHGWTGHTTYETLTAATLTGEKPAPAVTLEFAAPTAFKSREMTMPVPLPGLVFGSLVERWNTFSPVTLSPEMRRFGEEMVAISRYKLESRAVEQKNQALRIGGMGEVSYRSLARDRYWLSVMHMLADFALFSGVGVQTATGMGQVRRIGG